MNSTLTTPPHLRPLRLASILTLALLVSACAGSRPAQLGGPQDSLSPCPDKPNCVSSLAPTDSEHYIAPLQTSDEGATQRQIVTILTAMPEAEVIVEAESYVYAEFTSEWMGFVDDVEFLSGTEDGLIHVRSASRLGYKDFDVNRERIETLRDQLVRN